MRTFRGAWSLAGLAAGVAGLATSYFVAMAMTIRESPVVAVAELVIRLTPGASRRTSSSRSASSTSRCCCSASSWSSRPVFAWSGRLARRDLVGAGRRVRRARGRRRGRGRGPARGHRDRLHPGRRRLRDLAGHALGPDRAAAGARARPRAPLGALRGRRDPRPRRGRRARSLAPGPHPPGLRDPRRDHRRGRRRAGRGRPRGRSRPPPRRGVPPAAPADRRLRAGGLAGHPGRRQGGDARGGPRATSST